MRYLHRAVLSLALIPLTSLSFVAVNLQVSTRSKTVQVGSAAQAGKNEATMRVLRFVAGHVIQAGTMWALDEIMVRFFPRNDTLAPFGTGSNTGLVYVGSSFVGSIQIPVQAQVGHPHPYAVTTGPYNPYPTYPTQGNLVQSVPVNFFANTSGQWYGQIQGANRWDPVPVPNFAVYRTADIFMNSSGQLFFTAPSL